MIEQSTTITIDNLLDMNVFLLGWIDDDKYPGKGCKFWYGPWTGQVWKSLHTPRACWTASEQRLWLQLDHEGIVSEIEKQQVPIEVLITSILRLTKGKESENYGFFD